MFPLSILTAASTTAVVRMDMDGTAYVQEVRTVRTTRSQGGFEFVLESTYSNAVLVKNVRNTRIRSTVQNIRTARGFTVRIARTAAVCKVDHTSSPRCPNPLPV